MDYASRQLLHLLVWTILSVSSVAVKNLTTSVCTTSESGQPVLRLSCPGGGLIYVLQAFHGRSHSGLCAFSESDTCLSNSLYSEHVVTCLGKTWCTIPAQAVSLPRCAAQSDYLQVVYQCIADEASSRFDICGGMTGGSGQRTGVPLVAEGHIMTPSFPSPYPRRVLCECLITAALSADTHIELELLHFHLEASPGCQRDYVQLERGSGDGPGRGGERMCGGIGRWARRTVNSTWARLRLHTDGGGEFQGFWIRVWALTKNNASVPVTVTCQRHLFPAPDPPPSDTQGNPTTPPGVLTTKDARHIWVGTLPVGGSTVTSGRDARQQSVSRNTGVIIGVCVAGLVTIIIINVVGIIICRRNVQASRAKRAADASRQAAKSADSFSSLDTEYVSLNSHGALYQGQLPADGTVYCGQQPLDGTVYCGQQAQDSEVYRGQQPLDGTVYCGQQARDSEVYQGQHRLDDAVCHGQQPLDGDVYRGQPPRDNTVYCGQQPADGTVYCGQLPEDGRLYAASKPGSKPSAKGCTLPAPPSDVTPDAMSAVTAPGVIVARTPGVGQSSVTPSDYDYGMLPPTYTRKSHTLPERAPDGEDEDPYAVLRDYARPAMPPCGNYARPAPPPRHDSYRSRRAEHDYDEIDEYPVAADLVRSGQGLDSRASTRSHHSTLSYSDPAPRPPRSQGSGSSGHASCSSTDDDVMRPSRDVIGSSFRTPHNEAECVSSHPGLVYSNEARCEISDYADTGDYADTVEYAHSEASTTRSEYL